MLALAATGAYASLHDRQYMPENIEMQNAQTLRNVCLPFTMPDYYPDWSAPCNALRAIVYQCQYGPDMLRQLNVSYHNPYGDGDRPDVGASLKQLRKRQSDDASDSDPEELDTATQRTCICESQFFEQAQGCADCYRAHGGEAYASELGADKFDGIGNSYCAASATPTQGFADYFDGVVSTSDSTASQTPISDPHANQTAVSIYFTASVTGTPAYVVAMPTMTASRSSNGTAVSYASSNIVSSQIAPTASVNNEAASNGGSSASGSGASGAAAPGSSTGTSSAGAIETAVVKAGAMGFVGFAAAVAML